MNELSKNGVPRIVLEADNIVGGIVRTANYNGYLLGIGNIMGTSRYNLWNIDADADYHQVGATITEEQRKAHESTQPVAPSRLGAA